MHNIPECAPTGVGAGPKKIGYLAGFDFHSPHKRQFARGLLLEALDLGLVKQVPMGRSRHRYVLSVEQQQPTHSPYYANWLKQEGATIIVASMNLYLDYFIQVGPRLKSLEVEVGTGLYEPSNSHTHRGYWAWLIREELVHRGQLVKVENELRIVLGDARSII
jgi:hypothetical protein